MGLLANLVSNIDLSRSVFGLLQQRAVPSGTSVSVGGVWPAFSSMIGWNRERYDGDTDPGTWQRGYSRGHFPSSVLMFSAVYACVSIISGDVAKIGIELLKTMPDGGTVPQPMHPLARILRRPNAYQTKMDFWQSVMVYLLLTGNAYILVVFDLSNRPIEWHVLDSRKVLPLVSEDGEVFYELQHDPLAGIAERPEPIRIPARYVIHHRLMTVGHPLIGVTPLYACALSAALGLKILQSTIAFFKNYGRPSGMLTAPGKISKETAITLQKHWDENYSGGNAGKVAVAGDGLEFKAITLNATDSQLIEQLRFSIEDVARCFRVPAFMLGDLQKVTYKNSETLARAYYSGCLQYHFESIENRLDTFFDLPLDMGVRFDLDDLLRTEMDVRYNAHKTAIQTGFKTINEVRKNEGDKRLEGGDEPLIQMQYIPLSSALAPKAAPEPAAQQGDDAPPDPEVDPDAPKPDDEDEDDDEDADKLASDLVQRFLKEADEYAAA